MKAHEYFPHRGDRSYAVTHYDLTPVLRRRVQPAAREGGAHRRGRRRPARAAARPLRVARHEGHRRRCRRAVRREAAAPRRPSRGVRSRLAPPSASWWPTTAGRTGSRRRRRVRLGGARRRGARRGPDQRGALVVPVQRPTRRQGDVPDRADGCRTPTTSSPTACARASGARPAPRPGSTSSASRWRPTSPPCRSAATWCTRSTGRRCPMTAVLPQRLLPPLRLRVRAPARDAGLLRADCSGRTRSPATPS